MIQLYLQTCWSKYAVKEICASSREAEQIWPEQNVYFRESKRYLHCVSYIEFSQFSSPEENEIILSYKDKDTDIDVKVFEQYIQALFVC